MARKTNKTAHVLNLLSKPNNLDNVSEEDIPENRNGEDNSSQDKSSQDKSSQDKFSQDKSSQDKSSQNKFAQENSFQEIFLQDKSPQKSERVTIETDVTKDLSFVNIQPETALDLADAIKEDLEMETGIDESAVSAEIKDLLAKDIEIIQSISTESPATTSWNIPDDDPQILYDDYCYVNVLEELVTERIEEFKEMFGVCPCDRCRSDIMALTLTNLPSKYVVTDKDEVSPLLNFYREKYKGAITTALSATCTIVQKRPHHR